MLNIQAAVSSCILAPFVASEHMSRPQFIHGIHQLQHFRSHWPGGCGLTIGAFDGVHRGHQALLKEVIDQASQRALPSVVMVFEPLPHEYFAADKAPARLNSLREKVALLFSHGIDVVVCLKFNKALRELSAAEFVKQLLVDALGTKYLVVGDDFRFGCDRTGDFAMLQREGRAQGFTVCDTHTQQQAGERISSTRIRALLQQNCFAAAKELLSYDYAMTGRVVYGNQLGRQLGFPTANLNLGKRNLPLQGVFAVTVTCAGKEYPAVANVGVRPTINGALKPLLEAHLLDFSGDLYGQRISVKFNHKIRQEMRFDSLDALKKQIFADVEQAKIFFSKHH